jgi:hypothetical protein
VGIPFLAAAAACGRRASCAVGVGGHLLPSDDVAVRGQGTENCDAEDESGRAERIAQVEVIMIQLRFNSLSGTDPLIVGPAPFFRIDGRLLRQGPDCDLVGRYFDHHWEVGGRYVSSHECRERNCVRFEDHAGSVWKVYGPFQEVRFPNGSCYADGELLAELIEDTDQWLHRGDRTKWPVIVISPAG